MGKLQVHNWPKNTTKTRLLFSKTKTSGWWQRLMGKFCIPTRQQWDVSSCQMLNKTAGSIYTSSHACWWKSRNKMKVLRWPSQSWNVCHVEMQWNDVEQLVHAWKSANVAELVQFCKEERVKIPPQRAMSVHTQTRWKTLLPWGAKMLLFLCQRGT